MLQKEYLFYKRKYRLHAIRESIHFLRMRPENFPTIRLAQLAMLIHDSSHLFSKVIEMHSITEIKALLNVTANDYWHYHYTFEEPTVFREKKLGKQMIDSIIINTVVPILFAYGHHHKENRYKEKALRWLEQTGDEKNNITGSFKLIGILSNHAYDSQSLIQLKNEYCDKRRCLECAVGNSLVRPQNVGLS